MKTIEDHIKVISENIEKLADTKAKILFCHGFKETNAVEIHTRNMVIYSKNIETGLENMLFAFEQELKKKYKLASRY